MSTPTLFDIPTIGTTFGADTPRVHRNDPITSHQAADSNDVAASRGVVLAAFHERTFFADHELVAFLGSSGFTPQRIRTARKELSDDGVVVLADHSTVTESGRAARVWTLRKDAA